MAREPHKSGIFEAYEKLRAKVPPTPLLRVEMGAGTLWLKCESDQPVGAFKLRGAWHRLTALNSDERARGVVAFSSGNHAQGVAWAARRLGIAATIVMPADAPKMKLEGTRALGADVVLYDRDTESREEIAQRLAEERGATLVPSFDDPWIVEGQGSAGIEALAQMRDQGVDGPNMAVTPCGGGGLAAGLALALPDAAIVIVEPDGWDDMGCSLRSGMIQPVGPNPPPTSCDALQTKQVASITFDILKARGAAALSVSESEIFTAMRYCADRFGKVIEPGGAVALAAILAGKVTLPPHTLVLLSGGNVDRAFYEMVLNLP